MLEYELSRWAEEAVAPVAATIASRIGREYEAKWKAEWVLCDCLCAFDSLAAGGAGLAAFTEIISFLSDARLPWPERLIAYALQQDRCSLGLEMPTGAEGFANGAEAIRMGVVKRIRSAALSDVLRDAEINAHLATEEHRQRLITELGRERGEAMYRLLTTEVNADHRLREAAAIAVERMRLWVVEERARGLEVSLEPSISGEAAYRSANEVWKDLQDRVDPKGDLNAALRSFGRLSPGRFYVPRAETLTNLGLGDLAAFSGQWITPTGPHLPRP